MDSQHEPRLNPYATQTSSDPESLEPLGIGGLPTPVCFSGKLSLDDLLTACRDTPPARRSGLLGSALRTFFFVSALGWIAFLGFGTDELNDLLPMIYVVVAFLATPIWTRLYNHYSPIAITRRKRARKAASVAKTTYGWADETQLMSWSEGNYTRIRWPMFARALLFPQHLLLALASDQTRRIILPSRFFASADDFHRLRRYAFSRCGSVNQGIPKDTDALNWPDATAALPAIDIEASRNWDEENWPFPTTPTDQHQATLNLKGETRSWQFKFRLLRSILMMIVGAFFPLWAALGIWLVQQFIAVGDWTFLVDNFTMNLFLIGPVIALSVVSLYSVVGALVQIKNFTSHPMIITLRKEGLHLTHESADAWMLWSEIEAIVDEANFAGWLLHGTSDRVAYNRACFADHQAFVQFKASSVRYFSAAGPSSIA